MKTMAEEEVVEIFNGLDNSEIMDNYQRADLTRMFYAIFQDFPPGRYIKVDILNDIRGYTNEIKNKSK